MHVQQPALRKKHGLSLVEVLLVVSILGIIASISVLNFSNSLDGSKNAIAADLEGKLNVALKAHGQVNYEFNLAANDSSTDDEFAILRSLQWRDETVPGSPFFTTYYNPIASSDTDDHRLRWNGANFILVEPGETGSGLKVSYDTTDRGTAYVFPGGYTPVPGS
ncbi:MAG: prepilin-type N-terminal cleavage/methylation domain-containing protein [Verrucomicrobiota bacterium]